MEMKLVFRWRCVDKKCRKWYGWVKPTDEIPEDIVKRGRSGKRAGGIQTKQYNVGKTFDNSPDKSQQKKRVGRPPKSEVHGIKLRKPIRDSKFTPVAQTTGPRIALAKGTKRALGSPDEESSAKRRLYDQNQPVTYDDKVYTKRNLGVRRVTSTVLTSTQMGGEPVDISITEKEAEFKPSALERRARWWLAEKRRVDCSPEREIATAAADSAAAFRLMSQAFRSAAVTRADEQGTVNGALDLLMDSLMGAMGPLLGLLQKLPVLAGDQDGAHLADQTWTASTAHIPMFH
ncbi:hypothetical protein WR25_03588 [Diploscapter pachys]|uniref:Uncharacterized protein n=1 Tax=Diploscapter pachys TaxID=2018661 RepID=A0A2A2LGD5_9BILA|nr:hypothetical protein WR25_03588 [Diploscapter pachys]